MRRLLRQLGARALAHLGIVYDEPYILTVDDVIVDALNDGASLVVGFHHPPLLAVLDEQRVVFPQPAPRGVQ